MNSQASSISSDDFNSPRHSISQTIVENDDILEEVPMRYPSDGSVKGDILGDGVATDTKSDSSLSTKRNSVAEYAKDCSKAVTDSSDAKAVENAEKQQKDSSDTNAHGRSGSVDAGGNENRSNNNNNNKKVTIDESNNNEVSKADLEERQARERQRRAIANQTIITDDDPEE